MGIDESRRKILKSGLIAGAGIPLLTSGWSIPSIAGKITTPTDKFRAKPGGKKEIYVCVGVHIDAVSGWIGTYGGEDSIRDISRGLFAGEIGIPRILRLFKKLGIQQTFFAPGHSIETFPEQMKMIADAGHEIGAHGYTHENPIKMNRQQEAAVLDKSIALIKNVTGQVPAGYVAPFWEFSENTISLLLEREFIYDHSMMQHDFIPYYLRKNLTWKKVNYKESPKTWMIPTTQGPETKLIEIPASWYMDDLPPFQFMDHLGGGGGYTDPYVIEKMWKDRFDWMYREYDYAVYTLTIHPGVSGQAQNILILERLYDHIQSHKGVKFTTANKIASDFSKRTT